MWEMHARALDKLKAQGMLNNGGETLTCENWRNHLGIEIDGQCTVITLIQRRETVVDVTRKKILETH